MTAQGAIAEAALRQADRPAALSTDPFHIGPALGEVMGRLAGQPDRLMRAQADLYSRYMDLWRAAARGAGGETASPVASPAKGDKRFTDPDWTDNPVFDVIKQSYLITSNWLNDLVGGVEGVEPLTKRRVEFFTRMLTDAFSPSNFLLSNPAALREAMHSGGESLARGMENFAADLERGGGQLSISQTDSGPVQGRRERRHRAGQGDLPERHHPDPAVRAYHQDRRRDPAADLPAVDQQVLHPRPAPRELDDPLADRPGLHRVRDLLGQPGRRTRRQDLRGLSRRGHLRGHRRGDAAGRRQDGQHRRLLHRRHPALLRPGPHGGQGRQADRSRPPSSPPSRTSPRPATCCSSPTRTGSRTSKRGWTRAAAFWPARPWPTPSTPCAATI